jgi:hypothetical protein
LTASGGDSYEWSTGETTQSILVRPTKTSTYTVIAYRGKCQQSSNVKVAVQQSQNSIVVADAGPDIQICQGEEVVLTASGGNSYKWSNGMETQSIVVQPEKTTRYSVQVSNGQYSDSDDIVVEVLDISVDLGPTREIISGDTIELKAPKADSYLWSNGSQSRQIIVSPQESTVYSVTIFKNGCEGSGNLKVSVTEPDNEPSQVTANAGKDVTICKGESVVLTGSGRGKYKWSTGDESKEIEVAPIRTTMYTLEVLGDGNSSFDTVIVNVENNCKPSNSVQQPQGMFDIVVYPNPSTGFLNIAVQGYDDEIDMKIFDLNGRVLLNKRIENSRSPLLRNIDLSNLPKGLYFVKLTNFQSEISTKFLLI